MIGKVVHCKKEYYTIYGGRPSIFGNPFYIGRDGNREEVIDKYRNWVQNQPKVLAALADIKCKYRPEEIIFGCWCAPLACHCDVLVELLNSEDLEDE